jgi:hypothetical protein
MTIKSGKLRKGNNNTKTRKGGSLSIFSNRKKDTNIILKELQSKAGNIKLKDFESKFIENIHKLKQRKSECASSCLKSCPDNATRDQLKHMMANSTFYDWGNLCGHSLNVKQCREFIHTYTKLDAYNKYVSSLSQQVQYHFDELTKELNEERLGNATVVNPMSKSSSKSKSKSKSRSSSRSVFSPNQNPKSLSSSKSRHSSKSSKSSRLSDYSFKSFEP